MKAVQIKELILSNRNNYGSQRNLNTIKFLVIHYTGNDGDTAKGNCNYFKNNNLRLTSNGPSSAHYFVDDIGVYQSVPDNYTAYSVGANRYYHSTCRNTNSISIELCDCKRNGIYDFTDKTINNAVALVKDLMKKYNISITNVIRHYDVTHKICPRPFIEDSTWKLFKDMLVNNPINKFNIDQRVLIEIPVGIAVDGKPTNGLSLVDSNGYQFWVHSSVITNNKVYGLGNVVRILGNDLYEVKIFNEKFLCRDYYMTSSF